MVVEEITTTLRAAAAAVGRTSEGVLAMFHPDQSTVLIDYLQPGLTTLDQLRRTAEDLTRTGQVVFTHPEIVVRQLSEDVAISIADARAEMHAAGGSDQVIDTRVTDVWQRLDGRWLAVHEHASVPVDITTGAAILTLPQG